jgi:hypothetical protein
VQKVSGGERILSKNKKNQFFLSFSLSLLGDARLAKRERWLICWHAVKISFRFRRRKVFNALSARGVREVIVGLIYKT